MNLFAKPPEPLLVPEPALSFLDRMRLFWMLEDGRSAAWIEDLRRLAAVSDVCRGQTSATTATEMALAGITPSPDYGWVLFCGVPE